MNLIRKFESPTSVTAEVNWCVPKLSLDAAAAVLDRDPSSVIDDPDPFRTELEALWQVAFPGTPFRKNSPCWLRIGFQTTDPSKDVRAAGITGLRQCVRFCQTSGQEALLHAQAADTHGRKFFPLATASFNVSHMLLQYFRLCPTSGGSGAVAHCPDCVLRSAVRLQRMLDWDVSLLDLMHEHLLRWLWDRWCELSSFSNRGATMLFEFPSLLRAAVHHLQVSLAKLPKAWTLPVVLRALRERQIERASIGIALHLPAWPALHALRKNQICVTTRIRAHSS